MEAFGWLAVDGAYMYPHTAPTPSQVSALSAYNSAMRFARGGLDHLHLPVELRWSNGGVFSAPIVEEVADTRAWQTGSDVPYLFSSRLMISLPISAGAALPQGALRQMRAWRIFRCDRSSADTFASRIGHVSIHSLFYLFDLFKTIVYSFPGRLTFKLTSSQTYKLSNSLTSLFIPSLTYF